ncbi:MAG: non-canonical purine NTP diphosphatase [Bacteroidaceae bacterium]|nr:non-canonical purine NTP diphosphatase [Bacteroidaceae bacterium]
MVNEMIFVTNNPHKLQEVNAMLGGKFSLKNLRDIGCTDDIPETADTLEGNALMKARYIYERYGVDCFADDTGLEVDALNGAPGVYSARYAGPGHDSEANMQKLLTELKGKSDRRAQFRTVIALIKEGKEYLFDGIVTGTILEEREEGEGFGYDPIFRPDGYDHSFAHLGDEVKNRISHRARAVEKLVEFLKNR